MAQKLKPRKAVGVPLLKHECKSTCYAIINLELTSSRILSLLSLNSYTSNSDITGAMTLRMLSKELHNNSHQDFVLQLCGCWIHLIAYAEDFFKHKEM